MLRSQLYLPKTSLYPDFYLSNEINSRLSDVIYDITKRKIKDGDLAAIVEMDKYNSIIKIQVSMHDNECHPTAPYNNVPTAMTEAHNKIPMDTKRKMNI